MATKNYSRMKTAKLEKLMEIASEEEKALIQTELDKRAQVQAKEAAAAAELSAEEKAAIEGSTSSQAEASQAKTEKKLKMSNEEREALAEKLKAEVVGHKCQVVPFNTPNWVNGVIVGITEDKRSNKVLCAIKTDEGKRIVKVHGSQCLKIFDEVVDVPRASRGGGRAKSTNVATLTEGGDWDLEADIAKYIGNVGRKIKFMPFGASKEVAEVEGRIVALVPDKRVNRILYRIAMPAPIEGNPEAVRYVHKVASSEDFTIAEDFDEEGKALNEKYTSRRDSAAKRVAATPQDRVLICEANLKKAQEALEKAKAKVETEQAKLDEARKELEASLVNDNNTAAPKTSDESLL